MRRLIVLLLCALILVSATATAQRIISMATLAPAGSTWMRVFDALNRELRRRSNGQLSLRWYPGGVQGDEAEVVRKIRNGRLDGGAMTAVGLGQIHRPALAFQIPGLFTNPTAQIARAREALRAPLEQAFQGAGFELLSFGTTGGPRLLSRRAIRTPTDLRSARPWQWRDDVILPAMYQEVGANAVPLQAPEVLSALQTNRIDTVIGSPLVAIALQWSSQIQYMSDRSNTASVGGLVISRSVFSQIPADQQTMMREVFAQYSQLLARNVGNDDAAAERTLLSRGVQLIQLNDAERGQWTALFTRVRARLAGVVGDAAWIARVQSSGH